MTTHTRGVQPTTTDCTDAAVELKDQHRTLHNGEAPLYAFDCLLKIGNEKPKSGQLLVSLNALQFHSKEGSDNMTMALDAITQIKSVQDGIPDKDKNVILISGSKRDDDVLEKYIIIDRLAKEDVDSIIRRLNHLVHSAKLQNCDQFKPTTERTMFNEREATIQRECSIKSDKLKATVPAQSRQTTRPHVFLEQNYAVSNNMSFPEGPVNCNCDHHLERQDIQLYLPISAKQCFDLMFSNEQTASPVTDSIWEAKTVAIEGHDLYVSKWETIEGGTIQRILKYWMPVANPIVRMKEAEVVETQILINKEEHIRYTVQISTKTAALPYAEAFIPSVRYCITWVSETECKLSCYLGVRWVKSVLVKAIVTRAALKGMSDSLNVFVPILKDAAEKIKASVDQQHLQHSPNVEHLQETPVQIAADGHDADFERTDGSPQGKINLPLESSSSERTECHEIDAQSEQSKQVRQTREVLTEESATQSRPAITDKNYTATSKQTMTNGTERPSEPAQQSRLPRNNGQCVDSVASVKVAREKAECGQRGISPRRKGNVHLHKSSRLGSRHSNISSLTQLLSVIALVLITSYLTSLWTKWSLSTTQNVSLEHLSLTRMLGQQMRECRSKLIRLQNLDGSLRDKDNNEQSYTNSFSYKYFIQSVNARGAAEIRDSEKDSSHPNFEWSYETHRNLAKELNAKREIIAMLRYNTLAVLRTIQRLDKEFHESEYLNWLLDMRSQCTHSSIDVHDRNEDVTTLCQDINQQIERMFEI